jgi:hypothetical protein
MAALPRVLRQVPALDQQTEFVLAAYKSRSAHRPVLLRSAPPTPTTPPDRPGLNGLGQTLDRAPAERAQPEQDCQRAGAWPRKQSLAREPVPDDRYPLFISDPGGVGR